MAVGIIFLRFQIIDNYSLVGRREGRGKGVLQTVPDLTSLTSLLTGATAHLWEPST